MIKIFPAAVVSGLLVFVSTRAVAQHQELSLTAGAGLTGLQYTIQNGATSLQPGFQAGFGYTRFFTPRWGVTTGLELDYYQTRATLNSNTVFSSYETDSEGDAFEYRIKTKGYEEKQTLYAVQLPLLLQYQSLPKRKTQFYTLAGIQLSLPVSSHYKASADEISAAGYYPDVNVEISDLPVHGFGTQTNWKKEGDYSFHLAYGLMAEAGAKFRLSAHSYLYAGGFINYGLNDLKKEQGDAALLTYHPTSLSQSQATGVFSLANTTGNAHLFAYGIKLRFAFQLGKSKKAVAPPVAENNLPVQPQAPVKAEQKPQPEAVADAGIKPEKKEIKPESREPEKVAPRQPTQAEDAVLRTPIQFSKVGDTELSAAAKVQADNLAALLQQYPDIHLLIEGHTCDLGNDATNRRVGLARANAVATYLQQKGIDGTRMHTISKGAEEPVVPNTSEANRSQNRRVVLKIIDQQ